LSNLIKRTCALVTYFKSLYTVSLIKAKEGGEGEKKRVSSLIKRTYSLLLHILNLYTASLRQKREEKGRKSE
jgi:hypothetical protein